MRNLLFVLGICLISNSAFAFDCKLARSDTEKAICSDAAAQSADEALANAFNQLRASLTEEEKASLRLSQLAWIQERDGDCRAPRAIRPLSRCLAVKTAERIKVLEGKPEAGDVTVAIAKPIFIYRSPAVGKARLSIDSIKFIGVGAWQPKINEEIDAIVKKAVDDADVSETQEHPTVPDKNDYVELVVSFSLATPRLISVNANSGNYLDQAHPDNSEENINFDTQAGRELKFEDLLDETGATRIFDYCRREIAKEKMLRSQDDGIDAKDDIKLDEVIGLTRAFRNWQFGAAAAKVNYGAYAFGGYGACMCECTIPYTMLRPLAKKSFPLP